MTQLRYTVCLEGREPIRGLAELREGENRLVLDLPEGVLESVQAELPVELGEAEKIFMNGYQSWTWSPEYGRLGFTRDVGPLPELMVRGIGLRSYGDYFFVPYPRKPGITHGESWCYFREGERFRLFASLDEHPGYTLFRYDAGLGKLFIGRDCGGLRCGGEFHALDLFYAQGGEEQVFDAWFDALGLRPRTLRRLAGYTSWYNRYQKISRDSILSDLRGCGELLQPGDLF